MAGNTIATAGVDLQANAVSFSADMDKASRAVSSAQAKMNRSLARLDKGFAGLSRAVGNSAKGFLSFRGILASVGGAGGLLLLTKRSIEAADAIAKAADAAGLSTAALQELRHAGGLVGVEAKAIDQAFAAFGKRLGELRLETGQLSTLLNKLDSNFADQVRRAPTTGAAFDLIINRIAGMSDQADKAALSAAAFGRAAGVQMTLLVKNGAGGLAAMRQEARDLGLVLEEDLLRRAEEFNDELLRMSSQISTETSRTLLTFSGDIRGAADALRDMLALMRLAREGFKAQDEKGIERLKFELERVNERIASMQDKLAAGGVPAFLKSLKRNIAEAKVLAGELQARIDKLRRDAEFPAGPGAAGKSIVPTAGGDGAGVELGFGRPRPPKIPRELLEARKAQAALLDPRGRGGLAGDLAGADALESNRRMAQAIGRAREQQRAWNDELKRQGDALRALHDPQFVYNREVERLDTLLSEGAISRGVYDRALRGAREALDEATHATDTLATTTNDVMAAAINGQIRSWKDLAQVALSSLQRILIKQLEVNAAASAGGGGGGGGGGFFASLFGGGAAAGASAGGAGLAGGAAAIDPSVVGFADGGDPPLGRASLVGERGPELFVPRQAGTIVPNEAIAGAGRAGPRVEVYQDLRGADVGVFGRAHVEKERFKAEIFAELEDRVNAGGPMARVVGRRANRRA